MIEKICIKCKESKILSEFYKHQAMKDGHLNKCKECSKVDVRKNYQENREHYIAYEKERSMLKHRVESREKYAKTDTGKLIISAIKKKWIEENKTKRKAHIITGNAIKSGLLVKQSCESCGNTKVHAHHDDYAKPLDVRWLCPKCHTKWHQENGEGKNSTQPPAGAHPAL